MPEQWGSDADVERRQQGQVPDEVACHTKPQLAAEMVRAIRSEGRLPCTYLVADCLYGTRPDFLDAMAACLGVTWFVSVPAETRWWLQRPQTREKPSRDTGAVRSTCVVALQEQAPLTVKALAQSLASWCWYRRTVAAGPKGPIV